MLLLVMHYLIYWYLLLYFLVRVHVCVNPCIMTMVDVCTVFNTQQQQLDRLYRLRQVDGLVLTSEDVKALGLFAAHQDPPRDILTEDSTDMEDLGSCFEMF